MSTYNFSCYECSFQCEKIEQLTRHLVNEHNYEAILADGILSDSSRNIKVTDSYFMIPPQKSEWKSNLLMQRQDEICTSYHGKSMTWYQRLWYRVRKWIERMIRRCSG